MIHITGGNMKQTNTILDKILATKAQEVTYLKKKISLKDMKINMPQRLVEIRDFKGALQKNNTISIIAEIKKMSPSMGILRNDFNPITIASEYDHSGLVDAISVLTDKQFFQGDISFIKQIKEVTMLPVLRKDFIIDEYQIYESYHAEADALLFIAAALEKDQLQLFLNTTKELGLAYIVEVHNFDELQIALELEAEVIGVNARDLKTFTIDKKLFHELLSQIPDTIIKIAESGIETHDDLQNVQKAGAQAVLIGSSLMESANIEEKIRELKGENYVRSN